MKDKIFFPLMLLLGIIAIYLSIHPPSFANNAKVMGTQFGENFILKPNDLNKLKGQSPFVVRVNSRVNGSAIGPRLIAEAPLKLEGMNGAILQFDQSLSQKLAGKSIKLILVAEPLKATEPKKIGIGLYGNGKTIWQEKEAPIYEKAQIIDFGNQFQNIEGIIINPSLGGEARGIELQSIVLKVDN